MLKLALYPNAFTALLTEELVGVNMRPHDVCGQRQDLLQKEDAA